jgi:hypothetical protein
MRQIGSIFSSATVRNLFLLLAGGLLYFWPLAERGFASIVSCGGCSCVDEKIDASASCTAVALCEPENEVITVHEGAAFLCPNGSPVANTAKTSGTINGYNLFGQAWATSVFYGTSCGSGYSLSQCNGYFTSGGTPVDPTCCSPPPPPPPPCCGGCSSATGWDNCGGSPIILDIDGKGFFLTSAANGVKFDISGTGHAIPIGWIAEGADNAFLALPGADGLVHNGKALFGNFTPQPPSANPNGFLALAVYDQPANGGNGDGVIDSRDAIFASLRLWIDANHDGISQPEELHTLPSLGVNSIGLTYKLSEKKDQYGNSFRYRAAVNPDDPDASRVDRKAYDVFFVMSDTTTKNILPGLAPQDRQKCAVPASKRGMLLPTGK